ncbi:MAG: four helix bundle protein [Chloroflexi bacterium]|nr:four helix bundle protein [Chloroflexota bacterium]MCH7653142.1 four helix bundle protein [Chloroflexota bacterium]
MTVKGYRDLRVWQIGIDIVEAIYEITREFPTSETYGLASQMQRAAVSVPSNLAEGHTRQHRAEYLQFVSIAHASLAELETQLEIASRLKYVARDKAQELISSIDSLSRQLQALRTALGRRSGST